MPAKELARPARPTRKAPNALSGVVCHGKRYAVYPAGCLAILGLPIALLHQASAPVDYECGYCGGEFYERSLPARIAVGIFVILALWLVLGIFLTVLAIVW